MHRQLLIFGLVAIGLIILYWIFKKNEKDKQSQQNQQIQTDRQVDYIRGRSSTPTSSSRSISPMGRIERQNIALNFENMTPIMNLLIQRFGNIAMHNIGTISIEDSNGVSDQTVYATRIETKLGNALSILFAMTPSKINAQELLFAQLPFISVHIRTYSDIVLLQQKFPTLNFSKLLQYQPEPYVNYTTQVPLKIKSIPQLRSPERRIKWFSCADDANFLISLEDGGSSNMISRVGSNIRDSYDLSLILDWVRDVCIERKTISYN